MLEAPSRKLLVLLAAVAALTALVFTTAAGGASPSGPLKYHELPDPMEEGPYKEHILRVDPLVLGETTFQEPSSSGGAPTGANESITVPIRGVMFQPEDKPGKSPLILLVHGNHGECDGKPVIKEKEGHPVEENGETFIEEVGVPGPECEKVGLGGHYKRNDEGYSYLAQNLASWGYTVVSLDQDELMARQDGLGKGMHNRRLLIMAMLDKLKAASEGPLTGEGANVGSLLVGKLDMTRIGLMGHSRGGDAVSSFVEYDHTRPVGERYPLRAVISLAPVDYERHVPYGVPFMTVFGSCDGDVSNLQGARLYERSQYVADPYPTFQVEQLGGNHDAYNTVWQADGDDSSAEDAACGPDVTGGNGYEGGHFAKNSKGELTNLHSIRLSGEAGPHFEVLKGETKPYRIDNTEKLDPLADTRISGDPALMGDQEKLGLATMSAFFRRYVGGEGAMEPYLTGELAAEGEPSVPESACPTSIAGKRVPCIDRVADSYTAPPDERMDVLRPDTEDPTTMTALGSKVEASGFVNAYLPGGGVKPRPATTANGISWCDPDPKQQEPKQLKEPELPTSAKPCPQPALTALGGQGPQGGVAKAPEPRELAPVNGSYGRQLSLAWEGPAAMTTPIPAADQNVSGYKALYLAAAVNFFDPRNPPRGEEGQWNPEAAPQDFTIAVTDAEGHEATVEAGDPRYGTALQQTLGSTNYRVHVILHDIRVPLADLAEQGVDLSQVRSISLRFAEAGMPQSGSIQLADVRFQQPVTGYSNVLLDSTEPNAGPAEGPPSTGPDPVAEWPTYKRADGSFEIPNVTTQPGAGVWTVDDDGVQCPNAQFEHIQEAVEFAGPWDTIVVCPGVYAESSTPINSALNPVAPGAQNGLTINKPLKIVGAGAGLVKIKPAGPGSLAGTEANLRDGGGNVITVSRQSLGSTEYDENYVDISGVTIESSVAAAEAGVAFFNASGRISNSVIGPITKAGSAGWGVVETNSQQGAGSGTAERQVTISGSRIFGYGAGGVLFDGGRGKDSETATINSSAGIKQVGYVKGTTIEGSGGTSKTAQDGVVYNAGASGSVTGSSITNNESTEGKSVGVLLSKAAGEGAGVKVSGSTIAANRGYGLWNGDAALTTPSTTATDATGDYWGTAGTPAEAETVLGPPDVEGVSGAGSVTFTPVAGAPTVVAPVPSALPDQAPIGELVEPGDGEAVESGEAVEPVVSAEDDYGVRSVGLTADGVPVETIATAPYVFSWTPTAAEIGTSVHLEATITDSSGQTTTSAVTVPVVKGAGETAAEAEAKAKADAEANAAAEKKASEDALKAAEDKATAAEGKAATAEQEAKEAKEAKEKSEPPAASKPVTAGKVTKNAKKGTARLGVTVPGPGSLVITGPDVVKVSGHPTGPGEVQVLIKAKGEALKTLDTRGKVSVKVTIAFTADGKKTTKTATVVLVKN
jgi:large repetitive protein